MNILSLFDWMSCWQIALNNLWIKDYTYYASEIDKFAIQVTQDNFPNTIQIWDVKWIHIEDWYFFYNQNNNPMENWWSYKSDIDILLWWSPCQWFSFAWKQLNFNDPRSALFFEYVRILKEVKPKYFLLENVRMKKEYQDIISEHLFWIQPIIINSSLLTAQNRVRLYWVWELQEDWTYKQVEIEQPEDRGIILQDILENGLSDDLMTIKNKSFCLTARYSWACAWNSIEKRQRTMIKVWDADIKWNDSIKRIYHPSWKSPTLTTMGWWYREPKISVNSKEWRKLTPLECERLQWVRDWYTSCVSNSQRYKMLWNWWTIPVIEHILKNLYLNK